MAQVIRSGAFLQQCWSVHPLCVAVKRMTDENTLILSCSSCRSAHHVTIAAVSTRGVSVQRSAGADGSQDGQPGEVLLKTCVSTHYASLSLREMDVFQDLMLLRCAGCRRQYEVTVSAFETRHK